MEIISFVGGVWASIFIGLFIVGMVIGCTFDRRNVEWPKWFFFGVGILIFIVWTWDSSLTWSDRWRLVTASVVWTYIAYYLGIGLVYSMLEFFLTVRRSVRYWSSTFAEYKKTYMVRVEKNAALRKQYSEELNAGASPGHIGIDTDIADTVAPDFNEKLVKGFLYRNAKAGDYKYGQIIGIESTEDDRGIEPKINRLALAENVGVWTIFWPFYAVSLIIGDLLTEVFRIIADILAGLSGRFVKLAFRNTFKI